MNVLMITAEAGFIDIRIVTTKKHQQPPFLDGLNVTANQVIQRPNRHNKYWRPPALLTEKVSDLSDKTYRITKTIPSPLLEHNPQGRNKIIQGEFLKRFLDMGNLLRSRFLGCHATLGDGMAWEV